MCEESPPLFTRHSFVKVKAVEALETAGEQAAQSVGDVELCLGPVCSEAIHTPAAITELPPTVGPTVYDKHCQPFCMKENVGRVWFSEWV
jgi:hypothetical protein